VAFVGGRYSIGFKDEVLETTLGSGAGGGAAGVPGGDIPDARVNGEPAVSEGAAIAEQCG